MAEERGTWTTGCLIEAGDDVAAKLNEAWKGVDLSGWKGTKKAAQTEFDKAKAAIVKKLGSVKGDSLSVSFSGFQALPEDDASADHFSFSVSTQVDMTPTTPVEVEEGN